MSLATLLLASAALANPTLRLERPAKRIVLARAPKPGKATLARMDFRFQIPNSSAQPREEVRLSLLFKIETVHVWKNGCHVDRWKLDGVESDIPDLEGIGRRGDPIDVNYSPSRVPTSEFLESEQKILSYAFSALNYSPGDAIYMDQTWETSAKGNTCTFAIKKEFNSDTLREWVISYQIAKQSDKENILFRGYIKIDKKSLETTSITGDGIYFNEDSDDRTRRNIPLALSISFEKLDRNARDDSRQYLNFASLGWSRKEKANREYVLTWEMPGLKKWEKGDRYVWRESGTFDEAGTLPIKWLISIADSKNSVLPDGLIIRSALDRKNTVIRASEPNNLFSMVFTALEATTSFFSFFKGIVYTTPAWIADVDVLKFDKVKGRDCVALSLKMLPGKKPNWEGNVSGVLWVELSSGLPVYLDLKFEKVQFLESPEVLSGKLNLYLEKG